MSEIKAGDIVGVGPDGILGPCLAESSSWYSVGIAASRSIGDEPVKLLRWAGPTSPLSERPLTLSRDFFTVLEED